MGLKENKTGNLQNCLSHTESTLLCAEPNLFYECKFDFSLKTAGKFKNRIKIQGHLFCQLPVESNLDFYEA